MENKDANTDLPKQQIDKEDENNLPGYPLYPASEDIYNQLQKEDNIDPDDISKMKSSNDTDGVNNEGEFGSNLDVPGSELDDAQENIGNEDEENNYYSLGSDEQNDLEEDK